MHARFRHLRRLAASLALLLFTAHTLALAHVHADAGDSPCFVCAHVLNHSAAVDTPPILPPARAAYRPHAHDAHAEATAEPVHGFDARAPPAFER